MPSKNESSESEPEEITHEEEEEVEEEEEEEEDEVEEEEEEVDDDNGEEVEEEMEEEEEEEEEEPEEEGEEEEPEEEEEPREEEENVEERSADSTLNSPLATKNEDSSQDVESEHVEDLRLEKSKASLVDDASCGRTDSISPSTKPHETQLMELDVGDVDSKPQILSKNLVSSGDGFQESLSEDKIMEFQPPKKVENEPSVDGQKGCKEAHSANQDALNSVSTIDQELKSSCADEKEVAAETLMRDDSASRDNILHFKDVTEQIDMESEEEIKPKVSSSLTPQIRPRSLSPDDESEAGNKRPALVCDFFARGWCIKGTSCKFLHQKDGVMSSSVRADQDARCASSKVNLEVDEGGKVENRKSSVEPDPFALSGVNGPSSKPSQTSKRIRTGAYGESPNKVTDRHERHDSSVAQGDLKFRSPGNGWPSKVASTGSQPRSSSGDQIIRSSGLSSPHDNLNHYSDLAGQSSSANNLVPEHGYHSSGSHTQSSTYGSNSNSFAYEKRFVEPHSKFKAYDSHTSPGFYNSLDSSYNSILPSKGTSPLHQAFPWSGTASQRSSYSGSRNPLDGDLGYYSSRSSMPLSDSSSPFYTRPDQQVRINNWEPSVPFRPSFNFSSFTSSPGSQYDPFLDSIDPPNGGGRAFPDMNGSQGSNIYSSSNQQVNGNSLSFQPQLQHGVLDRYVSAQSIGALTPSADAAGTSVAEQRNRRSLSKDKKPLKPGHIGNTALAKEVDRDHSLNHQADGSKHNKESKTLKVFRASLVEYLKEMVKPHWREGYLSKDAHNHVVKKAVEKVLSALHPHQIPNTAESTTNYLSLSRPKLAKLVEGYVGKYAKPPEGE